MEQASTGVNGTNANPVLRGVETAGTALHTGIDKVADPARGAIDQASKVAHHKVDQLTEGASSIADRFGEQTRRLQEAPQRALAYTKNTVQEKPLEYVAAALAVGFLLGRLTAR